MKGIVYTLKAVFKLPDEIVVKESEEYVKCLEHKEHPGVPIEFDWHFERDVYPNGNNPELNQKDEDKIINTIESSWLCTARQFEEVDLSDLVDPICGYSIVHTDELVKIED